MSDSFMDVDHEQYEENQWNASVFRKCDKQNCCSVFILKVTTLLETTDYVQTMDDGKKAIQEREFSSTRASCKSKCNSVNTQTSKAEITYTASAVVPVSTNESKNKSGIKDKKTSAPMNCAQGIETEDAMLLLALSSVHNEDNMSTNDTDQLLAELHTSISSVDETTEQCNLDGVMLAQNRDFKSLEQDQEKKARILNILSGTSSTVLHPVEVSKTTCTPESVTFRDDLKGNVEPCKTSGSHLSMAGTSGKSLKTLKNKVHEKGISETLPPNVTDNGETVQRRNTGNKLKASSDDVFSTVTASISSNFNVPDDSARSFSIDTNLSSSKDKLCILCRVETCVCEIQVSSACEEKTLKSKVSGTSGKSSNTELETPGTHVDSRSLGSKSCLSLVSLDTQSVRPLGSPVPKFAHSPTFYGPKYVCSAPTSFSSTSFAASSSASQNSPVSGCPPFYDFMSSRDSATFCQDADSHIDSQTFTSETQGHSNSESKHCASHDSPSLLPCESQTPPPLPSESQTPPPLPRESQTPPPLPRSYLSKNTSAKIPESEIPLMVHKSKPKFKASLCSTVTKIPQSCSVETLNLQLKNETIHTDLPILPESGSSLPKVSHCRSLNSTPLVQPPALLPQTVSPQTPLPFTIQPSQVSPFSSHNPLPFQNTSLPPEAQFKTTKPPSHCAKTFPLPLKTTFETCPSSPNKTPPMSPRQSPEADGTVQDTLCEDDMIDETPNESEAIDENFLANLAIKTNASFLLGLLPNRDDDKKDGLTCSRKKDEKREIECEDRPISSSHCASGSSLDGHKQTMKSAVKDASQQSSSVCPLESNVPRKSKTISSTSEKCESRTSSHSSHSREEKVTKRSKMSTSERDYHSRSSSSRNSVKPVHSFDSKLRDVKDSSSRKNDHGLSQNKKSSDKESGANKKLDVPSLSSRGNNRSSGDADKKRAREKNYSEKHKEVGSSSKKSTTKQNLVFPSSFSSDRISEAGKKKESVNSLQKVDADSKCPSSYAEKATKNVYDNRKPGDLKSATNAESRIHIEDSSSSGGKSSKSSLSSQKKEIKGKDPTISDQDFNNKNKKADLGNVSEKPSDQLPVEPPVQANVNTSQKNSKQLAVKSSSRAVERKSSKQSPTELPYGPTILRAPHESREESSTECTDMKSKSHDASKATTVNSGPLTLPQNIINPDPGSSLVITAVMGKANLTDDGSCTNLVQRSYESRICSITCSWCREVWNHYVLDSLFRSFCAVTVKSSITFGAIYLMYEWASHEKLPDKEEAILGLLERADLSKNLQGKKISSLVDWIVYKLKVKEQKCCDVFSLVYLSDRSLNSMLKRLESSGNQRVQTETLAYPAASDTVDTVNGNLPKVAQPTKSQEGCQKLPQQLQVASNSTSPKSLQFNYATTTTTSAGNASETKRSALNTIAVYRKEGSCDSDAQNLPSGNGQDQSLSTCPQSAIKEERRAQPEQPIDKNVIKDMDVLSKSSVSRNSYVKSKKGMPANVSILHPRLQNGPTNREHLQDSAVEENFKFLCENSYSLSPDVEQIFLELPFKDYVGRRNSPRILSNREVLSLHFLCIVKPTTPKTVLLYKSLVQIAKARGRIILVPDHIFLVKLTEKLYRYFEKKKENVKEFLDAPSPIDKLSTITSSISTHKKVTVGILLGIFCSWKNWPYIHWQESTSEEDSLLSRPSLQKVFNDHSIYMTRCNYILYDCLRIHDKFCYYAFISNDATQAQLFLSRPWSSQILASSLEESFFERLQWNPSLLESDSLPIRNRMEKTSSEETQNLRNDAALNEESLPVFKRRKIGGDVKGFRRSALRSSAPKRHLDEDFSKLSSKRLKCGQFIERKQTLPSALLLTHEYRLVKVLSMMLTAKQEKILRQLSSTRVGVKRSIQETEFPTPCIGKHAKADYHDTVRDQEGDNVELSSSKASIDGKGSESLSDAALDYGSGDAQEKSLKTPALNTKRKTDCSNTAGNLENIPDPTRRSRGAISSTESSVCVTQNSGSNKCVAPSSTDTAIFNAPVATASKASNLSRPNRKSAEDIPTSSPKVHDESSAPLVCQTKAGEDELSPALQATVRALLQSRKAKKSDVALILMNSLKLLNVECNVRPTHEIITMYAHSINM
ncbi:hypothetical protein FHG87_011828 [Trinorchestia longiramus]|nr:hypothetical protein FHG87_011828 [Trinorchestia longiramus]